ncbi:hypothetical protein ABIB25_005897 [Nakamurella sp. UYEF19]
MIDTQACSGIALIAAVIAGSIGGGDGKPGAGGQDRGDDAVVVERRIQPGADHRRRVTGAARCGDRIGKELPRAAGGIHRPFAQAVPDDDRPA